MKKLFWFLIILFSFVYILPIFAGWVVNTNTTPLINDAAASSTKPNISTTTPDTRWITMNETCLLNGQCGFNIYEFLGIRKSIADNSSPELFVQDILLSATFFIGTIVTIAIIVSGLMFVFAGATGKDPTKAKAWLKNSFIGLLLVVCSYSIIRVVQYIAKGL